MLARRLAVRRLPGGVQSAPATSVRYSQLLCRPPAARTPRHRRLLEPHLSALNLTPCFFFSVSVCSVPSRWWRFPLKGRHWSARFGCHQAPLPLSNVLSGSGGRRPYFRQNARPIHGQGIVPKRLWHSLKPEHAWILLWSSARDFHSRVNPM